MKRNSEFIGVDEKFIPDGEQFVNDSILGNKEETKNKINKGIKIGIGVYIAVAILVLVLMGSVILAIFGFSRSFTNNGMQSSQDMANKFFEVYDTALDKINNGMQTNQDVSNKMEEMKDVMNGMGGILDEAMENENNMEVTTFNIFLEMYKETQKGVSVSTLLDKVVESNKKNKEHVIIVTYKATNTTSEDEIVKIKQSLEKLSDYEVSLDYDANGYIYKVSIKDVK